MAHTALQVPVPVELLLCFWQQDMGYAYGDKESKTNVYNALLGHVGFPHMHGREVYLATRPTPGRQVKDDELGACLSNT